MTKPHIYKSRLLKLADFLEKLPPKRFAYDMWVGSHWRGNTNLSCGTTACALGWATTMPIFRRLGLRLTLGVGCNLDDAERGGMYGDITMPGGGDEYVAGKKIFGLTMGEVSQLFMPANDYEETASAKYVAKKIRKFVKTKYGSR